MVPQRVHPITRCHGRWGLMSPEGPVARRRGPLPGAGSAGASAGRFFRGPVLRLTAAVRRLLAGDSLVPGSAPGSLVSGSARGSLVSGSARGLLVSGSARGLLERGDVPVLPPVDEAVRVVEVLIGGQQVRMCPHGIPARGAPDVGQLAPDEGRLAQLARPELESDQGRERVRGWPGARP